MCYGEGRGKGRWVARYGFEKLGVARCYQSASVTAFDLRWLCLGVTHPQPLSRGEIWMRLFYLEKRGLSVFVSPLERGLRGVLRRGTRQRQMGCEIRLREAWCCKVLSVGFRWQLLVLEAVHRRDTPPAPLWDGEVRDACFLLEKRGLRRGDSPLEREGVWAFFWGRPV